MGRGGWSNKRLAPRQRSEIPSKFLATEPERESGEYCLAVLCKGWRDVYTYIHEWKFSSFHADSLQCVAALHQSRWVHILQPILLSLVPVISLPLSDVAETLGKDAHTVDFICVHTVTYSQRGLVSPSRIDTQTSLFLSLFSSLARVAFATIGSIAAIGVSFLSGTVAAINDRARRCLLPSIPERRSIFFSSTGNAIESINDAIIRVLPRVHSLFERCWEYVLYFFEMRMIFIEFVYPNFLTFRALKSIREEGIFRVY